METLVQKVAYRVAGIELAATAFGLTMLQAEQEFERAQRDSGRMSSMDIMDAMPGRLQMLTGSRN